jgi:ABC-type sugar transport system permease subunit
MVGTSGKRRVLRALRKGRCYLYLAPTFVLLGVFSYYPPVMACIRSFYYWNGANWLEWAGLSNYTAMIHDEALLLSVVNLLKLAAFSVVVSVGTPLLVAELIFNMRAPRAQYWYRVLLVVPMVVPGVVGILLWQFIYDPNVGLLNSIVGVFGLPPQAWLNNPRLALYSLMFMGFPFVSGIPVLIFLAGLNNVGEDVFDAARIDGATFVQRFLRVDLPLASGQVRLIAVLSIIGSLSGFGTPLILTDGGPGYATMMPGLHMYHEAFRSDNLGYACALGMLLFVVILALTCLTMRIRRDETQ